MRENYDDIINLKGPVNSRYRKMDIMDRAAQFSPFAALTGYEDEIKEAGRIIEKFIELSDEEKENIDRQINKAYSYGCKGVVEIEYFVPDKKKDGGCYLSTAGYIKNIDMYNKFLVMSDDKKINISNILNVKNCFPDN